MRAFLVVSCSVLLSSAVLAAANQSAVNSPPVTLASLQADVEKLKAELDELRREVLRSGTPGDRSRAPLSVSGRPYLGDSSAPVILVEYVDFQCPFCARHAKTTFAQLRTRYMDTRLVQYVVKSMPLENVHSLAFQAAVAAECGHRQQRYWRVHDALFDDPRRVSDLIGFAQQNDLQVGAFQSCVKDVSAASQVRNDMAEARQLGLEGTPAFVIGRRLPDGTSLRPQLILSGALPVDRFAAAIDMVLTAEHDAHGVK